MPNINLKSRSRKVEPMADEEPTGRVDAIERAICAERCALYGDPPCWRVSPEEWPNRECDDPGCRALACVAEIAVRAYEKDAP